MPLQQISLDQSIYNKNKTNNIKQVSNAPKTRYAGELPTSNRFIDEQRALWAAEDKATKERRAAQSDAAQELGLRVADVMGKQQQGQVQQQQAMAQQVEQNPYGAAEEMFKFMLTLPEENQNALLQQIFTPTEASGTITMGGRTEKVGGGEYNPIANVFVEKGWAMVDKQGNVTLNRPVKETEKGTYTYNAEDNLIVDTATGETKNVTIPKDAEDKITPEDIIKVASEARSLITGLVDPSYIEGLTPEGRSTFFENAKKSYKEQIAYLFGLAYNVTPEEATKIANSVPSLTEKDFTATPTTATTPPPAKTGDEAMANNIYNAIKDKPSISQEEKDYYISQYGADTWALVKEMLDKNKPVSPIPTAPVSQTPKTPASLNFNLQEKLKEIRERR